MTGQDAVTVAESFDSTLALDGVILTKLDGDARGGAALSVKEVVGKPIAFASTGEKVEDFDLFHPDRLASRILGMGDVLTLIDKAEQVYEKEEAEAAAAKLLEGKFTLDDFLEQLQQVRKMGPLQNLMGMMPGMPKEMRNAEIDEGQVNRVEAIIRSMTRDRAGRPHDHRRLAPAAHRQRQRHPDRRRQPAHQAVPRDAEDDEADARPVGHQGDEGPEGQEGRAQGRRPGHPAGRSARSPQAALHPARSELTAAATHYPVAGLRFAPTRARSASSSVAPHEAAPLVPERAAR